MNILEFTIDLVQELGRRPFGADNPKAFMHSYQMKVKRAKNELQIKLDNEKRENMLRMKYKQNLRSVGRRR